MYHKKLDEIVADWISHSFVECCGLQGCHGDHKQKVACQNWEEECRQKKI